MAEGLHFQERQKTTGELEISFLYKMYRVLTYSVSHTSS